MSNAQGKGKRKGSALYAQQGRRDRNKARRVARDAARKKPLRCGHGSRHWSPFDGFCRRCWPEKVGK